MAQPEENKPAQSCPAIRHKTPHAVVAFDTLSDAMAVEVAAQLYDIPGRSIPVPQEINAGCGTAWVAPAQARDELETALQTHSLTYEGIYEIDLY